MTQSTIDALAFTRRVSTALNRAADHNEAADALASAALSLDGIHGIAFTSSSDTPGWRFRGDVHGCRTVTVEVRSGETLWGALEFSHSGGEPGELTALARFASQQLALALRRIALAQRNARLRFEADAMRDEIRLRKLLHRACGVVAAQYGTSADNAERLLRHDARITNRTLLEVAEAVVTRSTLGAARQSGLRRPA